MGRLRGNHPREAIFKTSFSKTNEVARWEPMKLNWLWKVDKSL